MSGIEFDHVSRSFQRDGREYTALEGVSLEIADGEFVAIVGTSGCGKTTLMRMAAGLDFPTEGRVSVANKDIVGPGPERAVVFQQFALLPWKTVDENIGFGLKCAGVPKAERARMVAEYVKLMRLEGHEKSYPHELSGGMQQRVAIARSFIIDPKVLLMDEPFGALDAQTRIEMQEELIRLTRAQSRTVLFITHSVEEAIYLADRVAVMTGRPGSIREIVDVAAIRKSERWNEKPIEEVMEMSSFVHIRTRLWKLMRGSAEPEVENTPRIKLVLNGQ